MRLVRPILKPKRRGFTLIELLIVIAIILILIAIALPNFLEAQIRARVTKAKGEIRTLAIAMESYRLDWDSYPSYSFPNYRVLPNRRLRGFTWLTTPNAYITSLPEDPFPGEQDPEGGELFGAPYSYILDGVETPLLETLLHPNSPGGQGLLKAWAIYSLGPDSPAAEWKVSHYSHPMCVGNSCSTPINSYSATNGTKSRGDILLYGGDGRWMGVFLPDPPEAHNSRYNSYSKPGQVVDEMRFIKRLPGHLAL